MRKWLAFLLVLPALAVAWTNTTGYNDTTVHTGFAGTATVYGKAQNLAMYENTSIWVAANDPSEAGRTIADSCNFLVGYQLGNTCLSSTGKTDTTWSNPFVVDSFENQTAAKLISTTVFLYSEGQEPEQPGMIDTMNVSGWSVMTKPIQPSCAELIRTVFIGRAFNDHTLVTLRSAILRRVGIRNVP
jgi:hypothetical protein